MPHAPVPSAEAASRRPPAYGVHVYKTSSHTSAPAARACLPPACQEGLVQEVQVLQVTSPLLSSRLLFSLLLAALAARVRAC